MAILEEWTSAINSWVSLRVTVSESAASVSKNERTVTTKVELVNTSSTGAYDNYNNNLLVKINGVTKANQLLRYNFGGRGTVALGTWSQVVPHDADGTKWCPVYVKATMQHDSDPTYSKSLQLPRIPRATQPTLSKSNPVMGEDITVTMPRADSSFTHSVYHDFGDGKWTLINSSRVGLTLQWTVPLATFAPRIPNAVSGNGRIQVDTYDGGGTYIGSARVNFSASIPASAVPSITAVSIAEAVAGLASKFGAYIQNKSKLAIEITGAGIYGSSISAYKITVDGVTRNVKKMTTTEISKSGAVTINVEVTDSRGRKKTDSRTVQVLAYSPPFVSMFSAERADDNAMSDPDGDNIYGRYEAGVTDLNMKNDKAFVLEHRNAGVSSWQTLVLDDTSYVPQSNFWLADMSNNSSFQLRLRVSDYFGTTYSSMITVGTAFELININASGRGIAFGGVSERDEFEVSLPARFSGLTMFTGGLTAISMPVGDGSQAFWNSLHNPFYFVKSGTTPDQPARYGFVFIIRTANNEWSALWFTQPQGAIYRKSGNKNSISDWIPIFQ